MNRKTEINPFFRQKTAAIPPKDYMSFLSRAGIIELQLPIDITTVISKARLQQWANDLETAYFSFYELTNYKPHETIIVEAYKPCEYAGYVIMGSNIIHIDNRFLYKDLEKMALRRNDWNFCALHEMGHMFDYYRPWAFETEMMTDLKLAYILERNDAAATPAEFDATYNFRGKDIINAYRKLGTDFSQTYNIFGCVNRFLQIKEVIGWEPFKQTFHYLQKECHKYVSITPQEKLALFVHLLSLYSRKDVKTYFSTNEWNTMIRKVTNTQ